MNKYNKGIHVPHNKWKTGREDYFYCMPLKSSCQWVLGQVWEDIYILRKKEALHQTLRNPPPLGHMPRSLSWRSLARARRLAWRTATRPPWFGMRKQRLFWLGPLVREFWCVPGWRSLLDDQGGVLKGASLETLREGSLTRCFFLAWPEGRGGVLSWARDYWGWLAGQVLGKKRSMERVRRITISSSRLAYASGSTDSAVAVSITWAGASDPSTGMVHSTTSRNLLGRFVSNWGEVLCGSIMRAKVPSFTSS